jgi:hypothetical protein
MDGLMDFEYIYGRPGRASAEHLVHEFFPGSLRPDEAAWWSGDREMYDDKRQKESVTGKRDAPRSRIGKLHNLASSTSSLSTRKSARNATPQIKTVLSPPPLSTSNESDLHGTAMAPMPLSRRSRTMSPVSRAQGTGILRPSSWDVNYSRDASKVISEEPISIGSEQDTDSKGSAAMRPIADGVSEHDFSQQMRDPGPPQMTERYEIAPSPDWV